MNGSQDTVRDWCWKFYDFMKFVEGAAGETSMFQAPGSDRGGREPSTKTIEPRWNFPSYPDDDDDEIRLKILRKQKIFELGVELTRLGPWARTRDLFRILEIWLEVEKN